MYLYGRKERVMNFLMDNNYEDEHKEWYSNGGYGSHYERRGRYSWLMAGVLIGLGMLVMAIKELFGIDLLELIHLK